MKMSRLARRLHRRLEREGLHVETPFRIQRTYAGRHQRAAGAWLWELRREDGHSPRINGLLMDLGSQDTATEIATAKNLGFSRPWPGDGLHVHVILEQTGVPPHTRG